MVTQDVITQCLFVLKTILIESDISRLELHRYLVKCPPFHAKDWSMGKYMCYTAYINHRFKIIIIIIKIIKIFEYVVIVKAFTDWQIALLGMTY